MSSNVVVEWMEERKNEKKNPDEFVPRTRLGSVGNDLGEAEKKKKKRCKGERKKKKVTKQFNGRRRISPKHQTSNTKEKLPIYL